MKPLEAIRCTQQGCPCECFAPGKACLRYCETCNHGWVAHALDKLGYQHAYNLGMQVEVVQPNIVFDIASLMLYGSQATPVRLKILLDRLFSVLQHEEVLQVLHGFGWSYEDYARGYILQDSSGRVLDKWSMATRDEEHVILQQFLRFGETKTIAQEIILQDTRDKQDAYSKQTKQAESEIKKFIERSNLSMQSFMKLDPARQMFAGRLPFVPGARLLTSPILTPSPYSPSRDNAARPLSLTTSPAASSTPLSTPPISRLQAYEFRRELASGASPAPSPVCSADKVSVAAASISSSSSIMSVPTVVSSLAAAGRSRSPVMESPRNLSATPSSAAPSPCVTPQKPQPLESGELSGGYSGDSDDDQSVGAIDYSTRDSDSPHGDLDRKAAAARHLRKSNNPIKRQWIPSANFGSTFIGPNGKKRVLCTACNKTFCDKGALKIHYSAVHLKEMHKCTVEGCNMMFSSRRSRNRHSANPNPKLHMPQKRKELEGLDDDGKPMSCSLSGTSISSSLSTSPSMVVAPALVAAHRSLEAGGLLRADPAYFMELGAQFPFVSPPEKRIKMENQEAPTDLSSSGSDKGKGSDEEKGDQEKATSPTRQTHVLQEPEARDEEHADVDMETDVTGEGEEGARGDSSAAQRAGGNRRKSNAPTRCAQKEEPMVLSDDNSDDKEPGSKGGRPRGNPHADRAARCGSAGGGGGGGGDGGGSGGGGGEERPQREGGTSAEADSANAGQQQQHHHHHAVMDSQQDCAAVAGDDPPSSSRGGDERKSGAGAFNFPQIASLLLASKEQREAGAASAHDGVNDDDDDSSENELVINGDVDDNDGEEAEEEEEEEDKEGVANAASANDNDHNHNNVSREEGEGGEDGESCDSVPSSDAGDSGAVMDPGSEVYLSKDNTRKCALCGKMFQNQFSVKIHFQNVHLKLMHGCTVDGCTAAFPSKRSRDRHSSNLNLHRKLMSGGESGLDSSADPTLREDILSTLYGATQLAAAVGGGGSGGIGLNLSADRNGHEETVVGADSSSDPVESPALAPPSNGTSSAGAGAGAVAVAASQNAEEANEEGAEEEEGEDEHGEDGGERLAESKESHLGSNGHAKEVAEGEVDEEEAEEEEAHDGDAAAVTTADKAVEEGKGEKGAGAAGDRALSRREEPVCMSRKPVCCGMTFHTDSALKEHYDLTHPSQTLKSPHAAATETLLSSRRPRHRPRHKNGLHRLVSTGRKNGFS